MTAAEILERLEGVQAASGPNKWRARCPAHGSKSPSLAISQGADRVLLNCHAGCSALEVIEAIGLRLSDLFADSTRHQYREGDRRARHTLSPRDALALLDREATVLLLAAGNALAAGEPLGPEDIERVAQARDRIAAVLEVLL